MSQDDGSGSNAAPAATTGSSHLESFWAPAASSAEPSIRSLSKKLRFLPSPPLRIQRVSQLDAELLDTELTTMLLDPLLSSLSSIRSTLPQRLGPEVKALLQLVLWKFSIYERGATYGAMLQNLRYRNEWLHSEGLQSTYRDAPLSVLQLTLHPLLTIVLPYAHARAERGMTSLNFSDLHAGDWRRRAWGALDRWQRVYAVAALLNFVTFLGDGKYRTLTDRVLGMRLVYAQRTMNRNVSFEFLNRQLVWHAFTEFLLFLLPLVKPRRLLRRLLKLPTHPLVLSFWLRLLPHRIASHLGLSRDASGKPQLTLPASLRGGKSSGGADEADQLGAYHALPASVCAICFERLERAAGRAGGAGIRAGIPSSDPLDPSSSALAPSRTEINPRSAPASSSHGGAASNSTSSSGVAYADAQVHTPYVGDCACQAEYCYYCLASKLLAEEAGEDLADAEAGDESAGAWTCLRCNKGIRNAKRAEVQVEVGEQGQRKQLREQEEDEDEEELDLLGD